MSERGFYTGQCVECGTEGWIDSVYDLCEECYSDSVG